MPFEIAQCGDHRGDDKPADVVAGDLVCVREGLWRVMEVRTFAADQTARTRVLKLIGADALNRWQPCTLLEPFDRPRRVEAARAPRVVSRARWMRTWAALAAAAPPSECPATIADAQVTLLPHQIDPVLAVLRGRASRLLLADVVGLGKTIQAALLVRELRARGCADRVLILVPSGLREQWRQELSHRTGLGADIIDAAALAGRARDLPPDVNPWSLPGILIVSLDFIKQPSVLRGACAIVWDILIADEAHNLNEGTDRLAAADLLARHSRHVVLLTATPHHGSDDAFATLCRIGHIGHVGHVGGRAHAVESGLDAGHDAGFDAIAIFRRTRQTMALALTRKVRVLRVTPTKQERRLHTLLARYAGRVECEQGGDAGGNNRTNGEAAASDPASSAPAALTPASLAMSILLKRASSSAWSLERSLRRRLALLDSRAPAADDQSRTQFVLPFTGKDADANGVDEADVGDGEPSHVLGAPGLRSARIERAWLTLLIEASRNASRTESKPRALARLFFNGPAPTEIYTEYRDTLTHLARTLAGALAGTPAAAPIAPSAAMRLEPRHAAGAESSLVMLHGGLGADERRSALARFTSGDARVLLTTDAAGEGLNLHHRCRLVVNVELPWNPNRLEQRIGRIDRLGQTRTVHAIHLVAADTAEEPMLARLTARLTQIAAALGDAPAVLRASDKAAQPDTDRTPPADAITSATCRSISGEAVDVAVQLQRLRAMRARAWRAARRRPDGASTSRGDPLLALDERAPLIAVIRRRLQLSMRGLLCVWRTRLERDDGVACGRAGPPSQVLTAIYVACDVPNLTSHKAVAAFVSATLERCGARIRPLLDDEVAAARKRLHATDDARIERLARRDDAIARELAAMLRTRADSGGMFQPLLFEDIAVEKTTMTGTADAFHHIQAPVSFEVDADVGAAGKTTRAADSENTTDAANSTDARERVDSTLVMALVLR